MFNRYDRHVSSARAVAMLTSMWMFNSWDRQPVVHDDDAGDVALNPRTHQIRRNFIFNRNWLGRTNSGYSIDCALTQRLCPDLMANELSGVLYVPHRRRRLQPV